MKKRRKGKEKKEKKEDKDKMEICGERKKKKIRR